MNRQFHFAQFHPSYSRDRATARGPGGNESLRQRTAAFVASRRCHASQQCINFPQTPLISLCQCCLPLRRFIKRGPRLVYQDFGHFRMSFQPGDGELERPYLSPFRCACSMAARPNWKSYSQSCHRRARTQRQVQRARSGTAGRNHSARWPTNSSTF